MKKLYFQPEVMVASVVLNRVVLAGSAESPASNTMDMKNIESDQW